ncbi:MAG: ABC transporter permease [Ignavibacteriales bacterium]|nr:ABC transporter permease [Ignavibacteriales bacterium]
MLLAEIIQIALAAIRANKLRSVLTLLGIVVGVFSIIGVMTAVRVLQNSIESGLSNLGSHTFQIQKRPVMASRREWLKARNRKDITYEQGLELKERMTLAKYVALEDWEGGKVVQHGSQKTNPNVSLAGEEPEGIPTNNWEIQYGRSLNEHDLQYSARVAILGSEVVKKLFPFGGEEAVGKEIRVGNDRFRVIGTFEPKGASLGGDSDNRVVIPLSTLFAIYGKRDRSIHIMIKAAGPEVYEDCIEESRFHLRTIRNVSPSDEDDFSIFSNDSMITTFNEFTFYVKLGIGFISFISLIAAGVGIMNIMLVSVTERTREIGVRKAVGAQKKNILAQFITEAIVLCQFGGVIGILIGVAAGNAIALLLEVPPSIPWDWAFFGFALCAFIGLVFGVYPAWKASNLDPVDALRYE